MRRLSAAALLLGMTSALVVVPTAGLPGAQARPVAPTVREVALSGLDTAALAGSPAPEHEAAVAALGSSGSPRGGSPARRLAPVVATAATRTAPFSAVGVTWAADPAVGDVAVQVRTRTEGRWGSWTEVEVQADSTGDPGSPEARSARVGSDPLYVGPSDGVQVRVDGSAVKPRDLRLALVDPGTSRADGSSVRPPGAAGGSVAHAAEQQPAYVSRAGWGADESLRSCTPKVSSTLKGGILHTTATGSDYTPEQAPAIMRSMYAYHTKSLGWCDIGYNVLVDRYGTVFEGRFGGLDKPVVGAHTGGFNTSTVGVSMIGNQDLVAPTTAMRTSVEKVFAWKLGLHQLDATGTTTYTSAGGSDTRYPAGTVVTTPVISGHRDYSAKSCPGNYAYPLLPSIRTAVAARMTAVAPAATALTLTTSPGRIVYGAQTTISGRLTTTDGAALPGKEVRLFVRDPGSTTWAPLSTRTTATDGTFSGTHSAPGNLQYQARFAAEPGYTGATRDAGLVVHTAVSASFSATSVRLGGTVHLRGTVRPAHAGQAVSRQQLVNGAWTTLATTTLGSTGTYSFAVKPTSRGTKTYRVVKAADADHATGTSVTATLKVT